MAVCRLGGVQPARAGADDHGHAVRAVSANREVLLVLAGVFALYAGQYLAVLGLFPAMLVRDGALSLGTAGVLALSSCRVGTCGTCETPIIEGEVDHRDSVLSPEEQDDNFAMMICVSRAACPTITIEL